ncbi:MAG: hypothetical protein NTY08_10860 [Proteobacteria bacterium]|nr:hypothetical protein [Pseudomonadota bacterium]
MLVCCKPLEAPPEPPVPARSAQGSKAKGPAEGATQSETSQGERVGYPDYSPGQGGSAVPKAPSNPANTANNGASGPGTLPVPQSPSSGSGNNFGSLINTLVGLGTSAYKNFSSQNRSGGSVQSPPSQQSPPYVPTPVSTGQNQNTAANPTPAPTQNQNSMPSAPSVSGIPAPLQVNAAGSARYQVSNYGGSLQGNKARLAAAADSAGANMQEKALIIAIAMQETTYMRGSERDGSKDGTSSANISILNMNIDMVQMLGYSRGDGGAYLNSDEHLSEAVSYLLKAFRTWGVERTLNFQRGGRNAFNDGVSYGAGDYRNSIATIYNKIAQDQALLTDGRRVEVNLVGV